MSLPQLPSPPVAERRPTRQTHHGFVLDDDYRWLKAENWQEVMRDPTKLPGDIRAALEAENAYTSAVMADTEALQATLFAEMKARIKEDDSTVPAQDGAWAYFTSYVQGGEYPRFCRKPARDLDAPDQVLIDGNALGKGLAYFSLGAASHSPDHALVAYAVDDKGSEYYTIRFRDIATGKDLADEIGEATNNLEWAADSRTILYTRLDENHRPFAVYLHRLGTPAADDTLVYRETDPGFFVGIGKTLSGRFLLIDTHTHESSEVYLIEAAKPEMVPRLVAVREEGHEYEVEHHGDGLVILTNRDGAEDFKIVTTPIDSPGPESWTDIEPHKPGRLILDHTAFKHHLVRLEREGGLPRIVIRRWADGAEHAIQFDEEAYALGSSDGYEYDTTNLRFTYSSLATPAEVYDYDMESRERRLRKRQEVPSGHDASRYVTRRIMAPAHDGETVPVSLIRLKSTPIDGTAPLLLYGYGSYGITIPAAFSTVRLSLVDRGFVYAIAHIRGGKDQGYRWYKDGKREKKINTFKDFISAGEHLAKLGYGARGRIVGHGGSAGGLLMGAVANMAPDLFSGLIAEVPFVDALNTMLDDTLPLTPPEWPEWGNPILSSADYETIRAYAPYENVAAKAYPHILAMAGLTDPRVTYWEPAKWVAKLRHLKTDGNLLLLKTNMDAGHGGASGRFERLKETALAYAFALKITNPDEDHVSRTHTLIASLDEIMSRVPGAKTSVWPAGEPFAEAMRHGTMSVEVFAPRGEDVQTPHEQDELYFVVSGSAQFWHEGATTKVKTGDVIFVAANDRHRFSGMSEDFVTWVVFWGPKGGERP